jgi:hypothetical protein
MRKILITIALIALILGGLWFSANWAHINAFPSILSSWYSKEFCSCHFVVGRDVDFCHNVARQWLTIDEFHLNEERKSVTVSGLGRTNTATFQGPGRGCVLENP